MTEQQAKRQMADTLEKYFSQRLMAPVKEWQNEADTNRQFYLGEKEFEFVKTLTGDEPVIGLSDENC